MVIGLGFVLVSYLGGLCAMLIVDYCGCLLIVLLTLCSVVFIGMCDLRLVLDMDWLTAVAWGISA